jgi:hypothetical protein
MDKGQSSRPDDCKGRWNVDSLHAHFERWLLNLEKHYDARLSEIKDATATALIAVKEQTAAAFAANKESVTKTEEGQRAYNAQHNDLTRKMEAQAARFVDRERLDEYEKRFDGKLEAIKADIGRLQEGSSTAVGRREVVQEHRQTVQWGIGQVIALVAVLVAIITPIVLAAIEFFRHSGKP